jgi:hypothetical protein
VRVAKAVGVGRAKLTLSMPNWGSEAIAPGTVEIPVEDAKPKDR